MTATRSPRRRTAAKAAAPLPYKPEADDRLGDPAAVGFRLLCLDRAIDATSEGTSITDVLNAAVEIRSFLLGEHKLQAVERARVLADAEAPTRH